jgi:ATP-binding cassette, subfamily B, multidrug efflux pump
LHQSGFLVVSGGKGDGFPSFLPEYRKMDIYKNYKKKLASHVARYKKYAIPGLIVMVIITLGRVLQPIILKEIIDKAVPKADTALLLRYALLYFALVVMAGILTYVGNILVSKLGLSIVTLIKQDMFSHLLTLPVSYFDAHPVGELMSRTENDTEKVRDLFSSLGVTFIVSVLTMLGMFGVTFVLAPTLALVMLGVTAAFLAVLLVFFGRLLHLYEASRSLYAKILSKVTEFVQGMEIVKVFDRTKWAMESLDATGREKQKNDVRVSIFEYSAMSALDSLVGPLFIVALILMYAPKVLSGGMTLGTLLLFFKYGAALLRPVVEIAESIRRMQQARTSLRRIMTIMSLPKEPGLGRTTKAVFEKEIRFEHVWFAYKDEDWVLKDVSFSIPKGSLTAVVGSSGSGKSTTVGLLCGFYRAGKGRIAIDGEALDDLDIATWRGKTGLVLQDVYLFPGSVLENVRVYNDSVSAERVETALANVHAAEMVKNLPGGLDANLWERGGNLSAGEKQLLAFARALAAEPELVILDEATSNIDMDTEERIRRSMDVLLKGRTSLIVAHRLSSILEADQILFFEGGEIVARGTHAELYETHPAYRRLVEQQFLKGGAR